MVVDVTVQRTINYVQQVLEWLQWWLGFCQVGYIAGWFNIFVGPSIRTSVFTPGLFGAFNSETCTFSPLVCFFEACTVGTWQSCYDPHQKNQSKITLTRCFALIQNKLWSALLVVRKKSNPADQQTKLYQNSSICIKSIKCAIKKKVFPHIACACLWFTIC